MQIGTSIYLTRLKKGLTQPELARRCGIAQANLSNIEKGKRDLNILTLKKIGHALGLPAWELLKMAEGERAPITLTRDDLERLARSIAGRAGHPPKRVSAALIRHLRNILSLESGVSNRALHQSWLAVLDTFSQKEVSVIRARVHDELARNP